MSIKVGMAFELQKKILKAKFYFILLIEFSTPSKALQLCYLNPM